MPTTQLYAAQHFDADKLAEAGARFPAGRLADGARSILGYFTADKPSFAGGYFDDSWAGLVTQLVAEVDAHKGSRDNVASQARPSGTSSAVAEAGLLKWVESFRTAVHLAPPELQRAAPHLAPHWKHPGELATDVEPLVQFAAAHPELVTPVGAPLGAPGRAALEGFKAARTAHKVDLSNVSPEVTQLHVAEGKLAIELQRLGVAARSVLPAARAGLYTVEKLHSSGATHSGGGASPSGTAAPPAGSAAKSS